MGEIEVLVQRDCLGGERIVELELPRGIEEADLDRVAGAGRRVVLRQLPRPFFQQDVPGKFMISGILSESRVRFTVRLALRERALPAVLEQARQILGQ